MEISKLTTIVFDLDGTLCEYGEDLEASLLKCFNVENAEELPFGPEDYQDEFERQFMDAIDGEIYHPELTFRKRLFWGLLSQDERFDRKMILKYARRFGMIRLEQLALFPEVPRVLSELREEFQLGLLTNGPSTLQWGKIRKLGIEDEFNTVVVSGDHRLVKPDPEVFYLTLDRLGADKSEAVYVGNSLKYDVAGAKNSGMPVIWRKNEEPDEKEEYPSPDYVIEDLTELSDLELIGLADDHDSRRVKIT